nr:hypothetical protein CFP56_28489 [Quercus suber]
MLCDICKHGLERIWEPGRRVAAKQEFLRNQNQTVPGNRLKLGSNRAGPDSQGTIMEKNEIEQFVYGHHVNKASFLLSLDEGCAMCNRFKFGKDAGEESFEDLGFFSVFTISLREEQFIMTAYFRGRQGGFAFVPVGHERYDRDLNFELGPNTDDSRTWSMIDTWLTTCVQSHQGCRELESQEAYMPTRIIQVDHSRFEPSFRLVDGSTCPPGARYITLSHCWGTPAPNQMELRESTVTKLAEQQSVKALPKTYVDAFKIAERFGVHYVWIDRLCIRQDLGEDWRRESAVMQAVYRKAFLSISALGAENDEVGCFFPRASAKVAPTIVEVHLSMNEDPKKYRFSLEKGWAWRLAFDKEPLVERAWTIQERLLAPRVLHFGQSQVYWECREANCCETHPNGVRLDDNLIASDEREPTSSSHQWKQLLNAPDRRYIDDPYEQAFLDWNSIVSLYVSRKLSVASDKLVAIAGLANDMKKKLQQLKPGKHRYLAGMWEEKLLDHIAWNVTSPAHRACEYRAPSWSWACLDGRLNIRLHQPMDRFYYTTVIAADVEVIGDEETGQVNNGFVRLSGPLATVQVQKAPDANLISRHRFSVDTFYQSGTAPPGAEGQSVNQNQARVIFDTHDDEQNEVCILFIMASPWAQGKWAISGLALIAVDDRGGEAYRRVGCASLHLDQPEVHRFCAALPQQELTIL